MTVITRFAPSPTGYLHIGSARTALFNWLYARNKGGKFLLRIEDTDRERSTDEAVKAIINGMKWLGLDHDDDIIFQFARSNRHAEVAKNLLEQGKAYYCYCSQDELAQMREEAMKEGRPFKYNGMWRDKHLSEAPKDVKPVIRLKAEQQGETIIEDIVQGAVKFANHQLDDMVLLRSDGTPTYMLAVVVDDHDMNITHIIRGDDHLTNAARQVQLYKALGWNIPIFAHIPLIHGPDGAKLSKRHGALGVEAYRDMGYLPETMCNYLLRLGWSHGDDEIIAKEQAIEWFNLESIGKSPARLDFKKLDNVNSHYIKLADNNRLLNLILPQLEQIKGSFITEIEKKRILKGMVSLKTRAKTLLELGSNAIIYLDRELVITDQAKEILEQDESKIHLEEVINILENAIDFQHEKLNQLFNEYAQKLGIKLGKVAQIIRAAITGSATSPSVFEIMEILGKENSLRRLKKYGKNK